MTGYAVAAADSPRGRLSLELRSVNARFLDLQFRIAEELRALEPMLREMLTARVSRGKLDCRFYLNEAGITEKPQRLNAEALARLRQLSEGTVRRQARHFVVRRQRPQHKNGQIGEQQDCRKCRHQDRRRDRHRYPSGNHRLSVRWLRGSAGC